jgi:hypothetical protein
MTINVDAAFKTPVSGPITIEHGLKRKSFRIDHSPDLVITFFLFPNPSSNKFT